MRRTLFVALCAVALFVFTYTPRLARADDNPPAKPDATEADTPKDPVTQLYNELTDGMAQSELEKLVQKHMLNTRTIPTQKDAYTGNDGKTHEQWSWTYPPEIFPARQGEWEVYLAVDVLDGKARPTSYIAKRVGQQPPQEDNRQVNEPENPCHKAFADIKIGMTADELEALYQKYGLESCPAIDTFTEKNPSDREDNVEIWSTHWSQCGGLKPPGLQYWTADLEVYLKNGKVVNVYYTPMLVRTEQKDDRGK